MSRTKDSLRFRSLVRLYLLQPGADVRVCMCCVGAFRVLPNQNISRFALVVGGERSNQTDMVLLDLLTVLSMFLPFCSHFAHFLLNSCF